MDDKDAGSVAALPADAGDGNSTTAETAGNGQEITAVIDRVAALRSEIDRLIGLVNSALEKTGN